MRAPTGASARAVEALSPTTLAHSAPKMPTSPTAAKVMIQWEVSTNLDPPEIQLCWGVSICSPGATRFALRCRDSVFRFAPVVETMNIWVVSAAESAGVPEVRGSMVIEPSREYAPNCWATSEVMALTSIWPGTHDRATAVSVSQVACSVASAGAAGSSATVSGAP